MIDNNVVNEILNKATKQRRLTSLFFEITNKCNLNCVHCYLGTQRYEDWNTINIEKMIDILKEAKQLGVFDIALTGGEIFTYKYWKELFLIIKQQGFNLVVFTNLVNLSEKDISFIRDVGVNALKISCYGMSKETYERTTRVRGSFAKYIENKKLIDKYKIPHFFSNILLSTNEKEYKQMIEENGKRNLELYIIDDLQHSKDPVSYRPHEDVWNACHYEIMKDAKIDSSIWENPNSYICTAGMARLTILQNGDVIPCINMRIPVGNIYTNSIKDIWFGDRLHDVLDKFKVANFKKCYHCSNKKYLTHICPGSNYNDTGDYYIPSKFKCYMCDRNREVIESDI